MRIKGRHKKTKAVRHWWHRHRVWYVKDVYWNCYGRSMPKRFRWRKWIKALIECEKAEEVDF